MPTAQKPLPVLAAMQRGDSQALSRFGRAGGLARGRKPRKAAMASQDDAYAELDAEMHANSFYDIALEANEHTTPFTSDD